MSLLAGSFSLPLTRESVPSGHRGGPWLAWDGRLDNRRELAARPEIRAARPETDEDFVLLAYRIWEDDFVAHLRGDFALVLWDPARPALCLARDLFGLRPLFVRLEGAEGRWSSRLASLLPERGSAAVDEAWVAGFLTVPRDPRRTPYVGIEAVPPGRLLRFEPGGRSELSFGLDLDLGLDREIRYRTDAEYEEHFRVLFDQAVAARLRGCGNERAPVFAELSGGLDSSAIVCTAAALIAEGRADAADLVPVSFVFDQATTSDERPWIAHVERQIGRRSRLIREDDHRVLAGFERPLSPIPDPLDGFQARFQCLEAWMRQSGARTLLNGIGGDHLLWSEVPVPFHLGELATHGTGLTLRQELAVWSRELGRSFPRLLWESLLVPRLPAAVRPLVAAPRSANPPWLDRGFARRHGLWRRVREEHVPLPIASPTARERLSSVLAATPFTSWAFHQSDLAIEWSYPFLDRPLIEFVLALPFGQLVRPGETRSLLRRALRPRLPPEIAARRDKRGPDEAMLRALGRESPAIERLLGPDACIVRRGWVDHPRLWRTFEQARAGLPVSAGCLFKALHLEVWLRSLQAPEEVRQSHSGR